MIHTQQSHRSRLQIRRVSVAALSLLGVGALLLAGLTAAPAHAVTGIVSDTDDTPSTDFGPATVKRRRPNVRKAPGSSVEAAG